jgi:hypothetical protein
VVDVEELELSPAVWAQLAGEQAMNVSPSYNQLAYNQPPNVVPSFDNPKLNTNGWGSGVE